MISDKENRHSYHPLRMVGTRRLLALVLAMILALTLVPGIGAARASPNSPGTEKIPTAPPTPPPEAEPGTDRQVPGAEAAPDEPADRQVPQPPDEPAGQQPPDEPTDRQPPGEPAEQQTPNDPAIQQTPQPPDDSAKQRAAAGGARGSNPALRKTDYTVDVSNAQIDLSTIPGLSSSFIQISPNQRIEALLFDNAADGNSYTLVQKGASAAFSRVLFADPKGSTSMNTTVTLNGVTMTSAAEGCPIIELAPGATVNLNLSGSSFLTQTATSANTNNAALHVQRNATLNIIGSGSLAARSGSGPGIGNGYGVSSGGSGTINIGGGTVRAWGGGGAAGIGGDVGAAAGPIFITGSASVEAAGGPGGPGVTVNSGDAGVGDAGVGATGSATADGGGAGATDGSGADATDGSGASGNSATDNTTAGGADTAEAASTTASGATANSATTAEVASATTDGADGSADSATADGGGADATDGSVGSEGSGDRVGGGSGIGSGAGGTAGIVNIAPTATVAAVSVDRERPAISATDGDNPGGGFYLNVCLDAPLSFEVRLEAYRSGSTLGKAPLNTLMLPAGYGCFAYTTGAASRNDYVAAYDAATGALVGIVVRQSSNGGLVSKLTNDRTPAKLLGNSAGTPATKGTLSTTVTLVNTGQSLLVGSYLSGGFSYSTTRDSKGLTGNVVNVPWGTFSTEAISKDISGLSMGTTYYLQSYLTTNIGTSRSAIVTFATPAAPVIDLSRETGTTGGPGWRASGTTMPNPKGVADPDRVLTIGTNINGESANNQVYRIIQSYGPGTSIFKQIVIEEGVDTRVLIEGIDVANKGEHKPPFDLKNKAKVYLILKGENRLRQISPYDGDNAALHVPTSASVVISDDGSGTGSLVALGGRQSAGIGGGDNEQAGSIAIGGSATITAMGGVEGAGIGGGDDAKPGKVTIAPSADVTAYAWSSYRPAIHATSAGADEAEGGAAGGAVAGAGGAGAAGIGAGGYYVNAYFDDKLSDTEATLFDVFTTESPLATRTLELPANYRCFAYTTGKSQPQSDGILAYRPDDLSLLGTVVRTTGDNPQINSVADGSTLNVKVTPSTTLTVSASVFGEYANRSHVFDFAVTFWGPRGAPLARGTRFPYTGTATPSSGAPASADGSLVLDSQGTARFTLTGGQEITIRGVPPSGSVRVVEDNASGYEVSFEDTATDKGETEGGSDTGARAMQKTDRAFNFINVREVAVPAGTDADDTTLPLLLLAIVVPIATVALSARLVSRSQRRRG